MTKNTAKSHTTNFYLFVYGTLRRGLDNPHAELLEARATYLGEAYTYGELYNIDSYPGLVVGSASTTKIIGDLYTHNSSDLYTMLDDYEECASHHPQPHEYKRIAMDVFTDEATRHAASVYVYGYPVTNKTIIECGDYLRYIGKK